MHSRWRSVRCHRINSEGWTNAADVAKRFGKKPVKWLELPSTKSYMTALERHLGFEVRKSDFKLVETSKVRGRSGTWLHPKLAVAFARWLDDDFAVWCDLHIDEVTHRSQVQLKISDGWGVVYSHCLSDAGGVVYSPVMRRQH
nr:KilA-N domain-containing protein [uncultured Pseudomonas sp.]